MKIRVIWLRMKLIFRKRSRLVKQEKTFEKAENNACNAVLGVILL
ncbi:MAG: hypothetical protein VZT48_03075 [Bulleidia sp.]|nr:hypothetical protein [Bulleidia sp.]